MGSVGATRLHPSGRPGRSAGNETLVDRRLDHRAVRGQRIGHAAPGAATGTAHARPAHAPRPRDGSNKVDRKVSSRLRAAEGRVGPLAGALVPADPPRSPDGKLQVYVDCSPLGAEQLAALEQAGVTVDGVEPARGRVRGSVDPAALDGVAELLVGARGASDRPGRRARRRRHDRGRRGGAGRPRARPGPRRQRRGRRRHLRRHRQPARTRSRAAICPT